MYLRCWNCVAVYDLYNAPPAGGDWDAVALPLRRSHVIRLCTQVTSPTKTSCISTRQIQYSLWLIATSSWFSSWKLIKKSNQPKTENVFFSLVGDFSPWDLNLPQFEQWLVKLNHPIYLKKLHALSPGDSCSVSFSGVSLEYFRPLCWQAESKKFDMLTCDSVRWVMDQPLLHDQGQAPSPCCFVTVKLHTSFNKLKLLCLI